MCKRISSAATPKRLIALIAASVIVLGPSTVPMYAQDPEAATQTATPIKHLVVIFNENVSFDHYFGTYPVAANPAGESPFTAKPGRPRSTATRRRC